MLPLFYALGYFVVGPLLTAKSHQPPANAVAILKPPLLPTPPVEMQVPQRTPSEDQASFPAPSKPEVTITERVEQNATVAPSPVSPPAVKAKARPAPSATRTEHLTQTARKETRTSVSRAKPAETPVPKPEAEVKAPVKTLPAATSPVSQKLYHVQVGVFSDKEKAQSVADELISKGYSPYVGPASSGETTRYKVQVGAFKDKANAEKVANELKEKGYEVYVAPGSKTGSED